MENKTKQTKLEKIVAKLEQEKWTLPDRREILPKAYAKQILGHLHAQKHCGTKVLCDHLLEQFGCIVVFLNSKANYITVA